MFSTCFNPVGCLVLNVQYGAIACINYAGCLFVYWCCSSLATLSSYAVAAQNHQ
jgi:hypothetical protein